VARDLSTDLIHHAYQPPAGFASPQPAIAKASTVLFKDLAQMRASHHLRRDTYTYGLQATPTTLLLEERIATLEGGQHCVLVPSGLAAVSLVDLALLSPGDEVLLPNNVYGPSRELARQELARWGIQHRLYDPMDAATLENSLTPATKLVWLEAPGSVTMEFPDLRGLLRVTRQRGVLTALDNTWGAGLALRGFELGIDLVVQALTKYPSGGGDVLMGSVCAANQALHDRIKGTCVRLGLGVAANDAELVLRSLPSMALRYRAQDQAARQLAQWLQGQTAVARVLHPALVGSPGHEHWAGLCTQAAGIFSVLLHPRYSQQQVDQFVEGLQLFGIGYSWAGPMSLAVPYDLKLIRGANAPQQHLQGHLVRLCIGLEAVNDLQADLAQSLALAFPD
jgi:cysteine-S-conjugate beta-lyase